MAQSNCSSAMHINTSPQQRNLQANEHTLTGQYYILVSHDNLMSSYQKDTEVQVHQRRVCFILLGLMLFFLQADLAESCCSVNLKQGLRLKVEVGVATGSYQSVSTSSVHYARYPILRHSKSIIISLDPSVVIWAPALLVCKHLVTMT